MYNFTVVIDHDLPGLRKCEVAVFKDGALVIRRRMFAGFGGRPFQRRLERKITHLVNVARGINKVCATVVASNV